MKIGIIGAGNIGSTIGASWEKAGHAVVHGLRDPSKRTGAQSLERALVHAQVVLLAVPGGVVVDLVRTHGRAIDGKIVIDATNNFRGASANSWPELRTAVPNAHLYRAFNTYGWDVFANPVVGGVQPDHFYCGPEGEGKVAVERLIADAGLHPIWVGGVDQVETVDGVLRLWYALSRHRGRRIAFKLLAD